MIEEDSTRGRGNDGTKKEPSANQGTKYDMSSGREAISWCLSGICVFETPSPQSGHFLPVCGSEAILSIKCSNHCLTFVEFWSNSRQPCRRGVGRHFRQAAEIKVLEDWVWTYHCHVQAQVWRGDLLLSNRKFVPSMIILRTKSWRNSQLSPNRVNIFDL